MDVFYEYPHEYIIHEMYCIHQFLYSGYINVSSYMQLREFFGVFTF